MTLGVAGNRQNLSGPSGLLLRGDAVAEHREFDGSDTLALDEIHNSGQPMRQHFRFASEGQSRSSGLFTERSPVCKHELSRFASNAVTTALASGSDDQGNRQGGVSLLL